jgi:hypothetical protein
MSRDGRRRRVVGWGITSTTIKKNHPNEMEVGRK